MLIQGPHGVDGKCRVWVHVENGSTGQLLRGEPVYWDITDHTSTFGESLRGIRVLKTPVANYVTVAGIVEQDTPGTPAGTRGQTTLVQCYGLHEETIYQGFGTTTAGQAFGIVVGATTFRGVANTGFVSNVASAGVSNAGAVIGHWPVDLVLSGPEYKPFFVRRM